MNESFVLGHIMSRNSDPEMVERAVAEYQSTPNLTNFCTLLFFRPHLVKLTGIVRLRSGPISTRDNSSRVGADHLEESLGMVARELVCK